MFKKLLALSAATVFSFAAQAANHGKDIVDTAVAAGQFKTLATALQAAGLVETLKGKGPFTVFATTPSPRSPRPIWTPCSRTRPSSRPC